MIILIDKIKSSYYLKWSLLIITVNFLGGLADSLSSISDVKIHGGVPSFTFAAKFYGYIFGVIYSLISLKNDEYTKSEKIKQIIVSIVPFYYPIIAIAGVLFGWILGSILVTIIHIFI